MSMYRWFKRQHKSDREALLIAVPIGLMLLFSLFAMLDAIGRPHLAVGIAGIVVAIFVVADIAVAFDAANKILQGAEKAVFGAHPKEENNG